MAVIAYIDPGAGTMLIQAVLAGLLAVPFFFRSTLRRAIERFCSRTDMKRSSEHNTPE